MIFQIIVAFITLYSIQYFRKLYFFRSQGLRGHWPLPFFGNVLNIVFQPVCYYDYDCFEKFGRVYYDHSVLGITTLVTSDPEMIHQVLVKDYHIFSQRIPFPYLPKYIRKGILFLEESHKRVRSIISPVFTSRKLKLIYQGLRQPTQRALNNFDQLIEQGTGENVNIKVIIKCFSVDAIARMVFALDIDSFSDLNNEFYNNVTQILKVKSWVFILASFFPNIIIKALGLSIFDKKCIDYFAERAINMIEIRRKQPNVNYDDFLQLLMEAESEFTNNLDRRQLDREEIIGQALMFFFAGMETISTALSNCLYELALCPDIQEKLYKEIINSYPEQEIDFDQIKSCKYLEMFFKEILRKHLTISRMIRIPNQDYTFPNGIKVKSKTPVILSIYSLHNDPELYPNPSKFDPSRFENKDEFFPGSYVPFSDGKKNCVGMRWAYIEVYYFLIKFCKKYRVVQTDSTDVPPKYANLIAMNTYEEMYLAIERRE